MYKRTTEENNELFEIQLDLLESNIKEHYLGKKGNYLVLATILRTLLKENTSTGTQSLLGALFDLSKLKLRSYSQGNPTEYKGTSGWCGLIAFHSTLGAFVSEVSHHNKFTELTYADWCSQVVMTDTKGREISRMEIIRLVSEKDGGAHVDQRISHDVYVGVSRENGLGILVSDFEDNWITVNPVSSVITAIAEEVVQTFRDNIVPFVDTAPPGMVIGVGVTLTIEKN